MKIRAIILALCIPFIAFADKSDSLVAVLGEELFRNQDKLLEHRDELWAILSYMGQDGTVMDDRMDDYMIISDIAILIDNSQNTVGLLGELALAYSEIGRHAEHSWWMVIGGRLERVLREQASVLERHALRIESTSELSKNQFVKTRSDNATKEMRQTVEKLRSFYIDFQEP